MTDLPPAGPLLAAEPCQSSCRWTPTAQVYDARTQVDLRVFRCAGCGSEWARTEAWTPMDAGGAVPAEVVAERARA